MPVPLYGFLQGDVLGLVILADEEETVQSLAQKLQDACSLRVACKDHVRLIYNNKEMNPALTVAQAGFQALDRIDVVAG
ncbi:toluene-4-monooxygenase system B family protein [Acidicapsa acidisoli]|uniref:toluene-4-monooxygenase system B family protein n=1 Tax=Acidicapsa acidisoli TaxID=1615681 RepID=UPI0021E0EE92|nr:toluene-4-monooxygenase system B family protein [Acidicapsa acidisoli]